MILIAFLVIAAIETHVGKQHQLYQGLANFFQARFGLDVGVSLWLITFGKLALMLIGTYTVSNMIWIFGNLIGRKGSRRVLFRRLAIVFTVLLGGLTASYLAPQFAAFTFLSMALYAWGIALGYFALRAHFELSNIETVVVGLFAALAITTSWHFSHHVIEAVVKAQVSGATPPASSVANRPSGTPTLPR
jgi:hypothetical protein